MENHSNNFKEMACIILAAGSGTRMKSNVSKVLFPFLGKPLLEHILEKAEFLHPGKIVLVVSAKDYPEVEKKYGARSYVTVQENPLGTGDAVRVGLEVTGNYQQVMILCGDTPLLTSDTLEQFYMEYSRNSASAGFISAIVPDPKMYGRVTRSEKHQFTGIVEFKDANSDVRKIDEVNAGIYLFQKNKLETILATLTTKNRAGEYYFTDTLLSLQEKGEKVFIFTIQGEEEIFGINNKLDFSKAVQIAYKKNAEKLMIEDGVIITDPATTYISPQVKIGKDTIILPFCYLDGDITIGENSKIGPYACLRGTDLPIQIGNYCQVGPFSSIRGGSILEDHSHMGTFVEFKKTHLGRYSKSMHLAYLGDCTMGEKVNIGAGTITCNYDGFAKHKTTIEDEVFIGSHTTIIPPIRIKRGSYTGAGSVITEDVPEDSLALGRSRQTNKEGWSKKMREQRKKNHETK
jgi:bifunctional UDP-N-acetylglucosamine pyrophosphorylase/glucosamine-1-phosphate N-acetyltransferase